MSWKILEVLRMSHDAYPSCRTSKGLVACIRQMGMVTTHAQDGISPRCGDEQHNVCWRVFGGRIATAIAYSLLVILTLVLPLGCSEDAKQQRIDSILHCKSKDIQQITLLPESYASLVEKPVTINDRAAIDRICQALNSASEFLPHHPTTEWRVKVEIRTEKTPVSFVVLHTEQANNGTLVSIMSHVTSGWNYGDFRCDSLAPILEDLARKGAEKAER